jgi:hypothetical protein
VALTDRLVHWARAAPGRSFVAERDSHGVWQHLTYAHVAQPVYGADFPCAQNAQIAPAPFQWHRPDLGYLTLSTRQCHGIAIGKHPGEQAYMRRAAEQLVVVKRKHNARKRLLGRPGGGRQIGKDCIEQRNDPLVPERGTVPCRVNLSRPSERLDRR